MTLIIWWKTKRVSNRKKWLNTFVYYYFTSNIGLSNSNKWFLSLSPIKIRSICINIQSYLSHLTRILCHFEGLRKVWRYQRGNQKHRRRTDNAMTKEKTTKHYTENLRLSKTNSTKSWNELTFSGRVSKIDLYYRYRYIHYRHHALMDLSGIT